jgi:endonuclease/exonuclease/phosphatase family metal-dependent hydrolase
MRLSHRVLSFNVNGDAASGTNGWQDRARLNIQTILRYSPDLIGFQEVARGNQAAYEEHFTDYDHVAGIRYGDLPPQERSPIFWKRSRYTLIGAGEFWFSETPDVESVGWGVAYPMGATWVRLQCRVTDAQLLHVNTHFEDGADGETSRQRASELIVTRRAQIGADLPAIVTGDFNDNPWSPAYRNFIEAGFTDTYRAAGHADSLRSSTFHGYKGTGYFALEWGENLFWRVDWILTRDGARRIQTLASAILRDAEPPLYPSDHYPIVSEMLLL